MYAFNKAKFACVALVCAGWPTLLASQKIEHTRYTLGLTRHNNANVFRIKDTKGVVQYFMEVYINAGELDPPDDQLGGQLCIRLNRAGGRYVPGCLLCYDKAISTFRPSECAGVFSKEMLDQAFAKSKNNTPVLYTGFGTRIVITIKSLRYSNEEYLSSGTPRVDNLTMKVEIIPDPSVPSTQKFKRHNL